MSKIVVVFLLLHSFGFSQSKVYLGNYASMNSLIYEITAKEVIRVNSMANKSPFLFIDGTKIYLNQRMSFTDVKYTIKENSIYKGDSNSSFDILFTLKDGKLYVGQGRFGEVVLYTLKEGKIYQGDSTSTFNQLMSYELTNESDLILIAAAIAPY